MAMRKINGRPSRAAQRTSPFDTQLVLARARQVTSTAGALARVTDQVAEGAEEQTRALDRSLSSLNEVGASLKETAQQVENISVSAEELVSSTNKMRAPIEQGTRA